jgi:hypothetical protein
MTIPGVNACGLAGADGQAQQEWLNRNQDEERLKRISAAGMTLLSHA